MAKSEKAAVENTTPPEKEAKNNRFIRIVDIGSGSIRVVVHQISDTGAIEKKVFDQKHSCNLGKGYKENGGNLTDEAMQCVRETLDTLLPNSIKDLNGDVETIAVATAAARNSNNGAAFIAGLNERYKKYGFQIRIISGEQEAVLSAHGALAELQENAPTLLQQDIVFMDMGGSSIELIRYRNGELEKPVTIDFGILDTDAISRDAYTTSEEYRDAVKTHVKSVLVGDKLTRVLDQFQNCQNLCAIGGTGRALEKAAIYQILLENGISKPIQHIKDLKSDAETRRPIELIRRFSATKSYFKALSLQAPEEIRRKFSVQTDNSFIKRIPTLTAAYVIYNQIIKALNTENLHFMHSGLREGIAHLSTTGQLDTALSMDTPQTPAKTENPPKLKAA